MTLIEPVDWRARSDEWQERYWNLVEAMRPRCTCPATTETIITHESGCPRLLSPEQLIKRLKRVA